MVTGQISRMIGASVKRKEDPALITGEGKYTDDVHLRGMTYMMLLRSPHAAARVRRIDVSRVLEHPNVLAVMTGEECRQLCQGPFPRDATIPGLKTVDRWPIATDRVCFVGEIVAAVVASDQGTARDALELIQVDYEPLPAVVDMEQASQPGSPLVHPELGTNAFFEPSGTGGDPDSAFNQADGLVSARLAQNRLIPSPMEGRAVVASYERGSQTLTMWVSTQSPHLERAVVAAMVGIPENRVRVIAKDVGGGFGCKGNTYPEPIIAGLLSVRLARPVKWTEERQENFVSTSHGRGQVQYVEAAYKNDGTLLGMRLRLYADLGAYTNRISHVIPTFTPSMAPGVYRVQNFSWSAALVFTNKTPYDAYRGAGRPDAAYMIERVMDLIAQKLNMDPVDVRRKNFIPADALPYVTPSNMPYDTGNYEPALDKVLQLAGYDRLRQEQERLRRQGELMGIGVTTTTEMCGVGPSAHMGGIGGYESAVVRVDPTAKVTVLTGTSPHGQGTVTSFAQIVADDLGVPFDDIQVIHGDTEVVPKGVGTFGSRGLVVGGSAVLKAGQLVKQKAAQIAAVLLGVEPERVVLEGGTFYVEDVQDRYVNWADVAREAYGAQNLPPDVDPGLEATSYWEPPGLTFPFSAHVAVVRIDPDTGEVKLTNYFTVDDCGTVINPVLVEGQIHGGLAQGIGQALMEEAVWDDTGQLVSGSFLDYAIPTAEDFPTFTLDRTVTPSPHNPMGAKGVGELGTVAATPTVVNAVVDALSHLGVSHVDMPIKPEKVWRILREKGVVN